MYRTILVLILAVLMLGCGAKKTVTAPVPGSVDSLDAWAYRVISDSGASIHSVKIWEQCTEANFPATVNVDGATEPCDSKAGNFPMGYKAQLNLAITSHEAAAAAGKLYHSGASKDTSGLTARVMELSDAVTKLVASIGGK